MGQLSTVFAALGVPQSVIDTASGGKGGKGGMAPAVRFSEAAQPAQPMAPWQRLMGLMERHSEERSRAEDARLVDAQNLQLLMELLSRWEQRQRQTEGAPTTEEDGGRGEPSQHHPQAALGCVPPSAQHLIIQDGKAQRRKRYKRTKAEAQAQLREQDAESEAFSQFIRYAISCAPEFHQLV